MVTKIDMQNKFREIFINSDLTQPKQVSDKFMEFYGFLAKNYNEMDSEAKASTDAMTNSLQGQFQKSISEMLPSAEKSRLERLLARMSGSHQSADQLIKVLALPAQFNTAIIAESEKLFITELQRILDVLYDITQHSHRGPAGFARLTLAHSTINELLVAHHLAQRSFLNQFYAHARTVLENRDKIHLFTKSPEWAEKWIHNGKDQDVQRELTPAGVREKIGKARYNVIYSGLSSLGTHSTFESIQAISGKKVDDDKTKASFVVWIGGCPKEDQVVFTHLLLHYVTIQFFFCLCQHFEQSINQTEYVPIVKATSEEFKAFVKKNYIPWAKTTGFDLKDIESLLDDITGKSA